MCGHAGLVALCGFLLNALHAAQLGQHECCDAIRPTLHDAGGDVQVTKVKMEQKQKEGIAEARSGQRGPVSAGISSSFVEAAAAWCTGKD
jgi:hypothetical protein